MEVINEGTGNSPIQVNYDGFCMDSMPYTMKILCSFEVTKFPFDTQTCRWDVYSNTYMLPTVDMIVSEDYNDIQDSAIDSPG